jgi:hypothetical protein
VRIFPGLPRYDPPVSVSFRGEASWTGAGRAGVPWEPAPFCTEDVHVSSSAVTVALAAFWQDFFSNFLAGLALAALAAIAVEIYLFNRRRRRDESALVTGALEQIRWELEWNLTQTTDLLHLGASGVPPLVLYLHDGLELIRQDRLLSAFEADTLVEFGTLYGTLRLANARHAVIADRFVGSVTTIEYLLGIQHLIATQDTAHSDLRDARRRFVEKEKERYAKESAKEVSALKHQVGEHEIAKRINRALALIDSEIERTGLGSWTRWRTGRAKRRSWRSHGGRHRSSDDVRWSPLPESLRHLFHDGETSVSYQGPRVGLRADRDAAKKICEHVSTVAARVHEAGKKWEQPEEWTRRLESVIAGVMHPEDGDERAEWKTFRLSGVRLANEDAPDICVSLRREEHEKTTGTDEASVTTSVYWWVNASIYRGETARTWKPATGAALLKLLHELDSNAHGAERYYEWSYDPDDFWDAAHRYVELVARQPRLPSE